MSLSLTLDRPGRHEGWLAVPHSHDGSAYGELRLPLLALVGGPGPTVLLSAGVHGDEGEGPLALLALARRLVPETLAGRVIFAPLMNPLAVGAGRRCTPEDGGNLARVFPGDPRGPVTLRIAAAIAAALLPLADAVLDFHAGGRSLEFAPSALARMPKQAALAGRVRALAMALGLPRAVLMHDARHGGTLVAAALERGIPALATEILGGGGVTPSGVQMAEEAGRNFLAALGVVRAAPPPGASRALVQSGILRAPARGLFRPGFALGDAVAAGDPAGLLHDLDRPWHPPEALAFPVAGEVIARGVGVVFQAGDALAVLASAE